MKLNRITNDCYYTESKLVQQLLNKYPISKDKVILEPCTGKNYITNYLQQQGYKVITNDIDTNQVADYYFDATDFKLWQNITENYIICDTVITNPPFNVASKILNNALNTVDEVIMLLRLSFLEPVKDRKLILNDYKDNLIKVISINPRPKFRTDTKSTDSVTVAWFVWNKKFSWNKLGIECPFDFITDWR